MAGSGSVQIITDPVPGGPKLTDPKDPAPVPEHWYPHCTMYMYLILYSTGSQWSYVTNTISVPVQCSPSTQIPGLEGNQLSPCLAAR
jgi:hypothetical protein